MKAVEYDLCVIGGGINGAAIARDAAGRGLSVILVEAKDLAQATSSASTKLIHGGLRYLEFLEFRLVRDSLKEREILLGSAPHIIRPLDFILPHNPAQRPFWMLRLGLFLYDHLAGRNRLKSSRRINLRRSPVGAPLAASYKKALSYADCWADDSRLVVLNAMDAAERGAKILTRAVCTKMTLCGDAWDVDVKNTKTGKTQTIRAAMVINAAGPWVRDVIDASGLTSPQHPVPKIRLVKGSHIIIKRAFEGPQAYILQQNDKRIVFAIPYERDYTLIGTTEERFTGDAYDVRISDEEMEYLCAAFNAHFKDQITRDNVIWTYSGVRPLFDDGEADSRTLSRDFVLYPHLDFSAPMLSVFGGKLTTHRVLAEQAVNKILYLGNRTALPWTTSSPLPGGDIPGGNFAVFVAEQAEQYPFLPESLLYRYARAYGTRMDKFLEGAKTLEDLGQNFGDGVYKAEIAYLVRYEMARTTEDILWRRSKLGMHISEKTSGKLERAMSKIIKEIL